MYTQESPRLNREKKTFKNFTKKLKNSQNKIKSQFNHEVAKSYLKYKKQKKTAINTGKQKTQKLE